MNKILISLFLLALSGCNEIKVSLASGLIDDIVISLSRSTLTVSNPQVVTSNSVNVLLSLKDQNGSLYVSTEPTIIFSYSGGTSVGTLSAVTNLGNGTYSATFTGVTPGTATTLSATVNGSPLLSSLPTVAVITTPVIDHLVMSAGDNGTGAVGTQLNPKMRVQARDAAGNPFTGSSVNLSLTQLLGSDSRFVTTAIQATNPATGIAEFDVRLGFAQNKNQFIVKPVGFTLPDTAMTGGTAITFNQTVTATAGGGFDVQADYGTTGELHGMTSGDFNDDGVWDLAASNTSASAVSVLIGNGNGTFSAAVDYAVGVSPTSTSAGDFNGDAKLDLVVANSGSDSLSILLGVGDGTFAPKADYGAGVTPYNLAVGDFNNDGKIDIVASNFGADTLSVLIGNGDGTFATKVDYSVGSGPVGIMTGDFNGDGVLDLAAANHFSQHLSVLLGNGNGTFGAAVDYGTGSDPWGVTVGDFNNDDKLDLAASKRLANSVGILLGNGDGTFTSIVDYAVGSYPTNITTGDFNGDGVSDVTVANTGSSTLSVLMGIGDGTFAPTVDYFTEADPVGITTGDFNGDDILDLATSNRATRLVRVLLGVVPLTAASPIYFCDQGSGTWANAGNWFSDAGCSTAAYRSPVNGDSVTIVSGMFTDVAPALTLASYVGAAPSDGTGAQTANLSIAAGGTLTITDGNWGGTSDVTATAVFSNSAVNNGVINGSATFNDTSSNQGVVNGSITWGAGNPNIPAALSINSSSASVFAYSAVTFTRSGGSGISTFSIVTNSSGGSFTSSTTGNSVTYLAGPTWGGTDTIRVSASGGETAQMNISILQGPDHLVMIAGDAGTGAIGTQLNPKMRVQARDAAGNPFTASSVNLSLTQLLGNDSRFLTSAIQATNPATGIAEFDVGLGFAQNKNKFIVKPVGYTLPDTAITGGTAITFNQTVTAADGGGFGPKSDFATGANPLGLASGDFNNDGYLDVAVTDHWGGTMSIGLGLGNGSFPAMVSYGAGANPRGITAGDLNGDGNLDLAVVSQNSSPALSVFIGVGDGTFNPYVAYDVGLNPLEVIVGDFNSDGRADLAVTNASSDSVSVLLGNGDGTFATQSQYAVGTHPWELAVGDFNNDGTLDIASANGGSDTVSVLIGNGNGTFAAKVDYAVGAGPVGLTVGDFDNDGNLDLVAGNNSSHTLSILLGNGDGTLATKVDNAVDLNPWDIVVGDFNGDGNLDLANTNSGSNSVSVLLGNGNGTFVSQAQYSVGLGPLGLTVGDFNGDSILDLASANYDSNSISVLLAGPLTAASPIYFCDQGSGLWATVGNWYRESGCMNLANRIPGNGDSVTIQVGVFTDTPAAISLTAFASVLVGFYEVGTTTNIYIQAGGILSIHTGLWYGSSHPSATANISNDSVNLGTVGNATFYGGFNQGTILGNAIFNSDGGYVGVNQGTILGNAIFNDQSEDYGIVTGSITCNTSGPCTPQ